MSSASARIRCKAAVFCLPNLPLEIEEVIVDPPKAGEVRVKLVASGVCRSDAYSIWGKREDCVTPYGKPMINGHEGSGVVESIGENVTEVQVGDHVVLLWMPQCGQCKHCKHPRSNTCLVAIEKGDSEESWLTSDGTSRYHLVTNNDPILTPASNCNLATFVEYAVVRESMVAKVDKSLPLEVLSLIGCCIPTGYGSAVNVAKVHPGSTCVVWGLGAVGMATILGCKDMGANVIIGVDLNSDKFYLAEKLGCNQFINPREATEPIETLIRNISREGVDYAFDCIGNQSVITSAINVLSASGTFVAVGLVQSDTKVIIPVLKLLGHQVITGAYFGNYKGRDGVQMLANKYQNDSSFRESINLFVSRKIQLKQINEAFNSLKNGENVIRNVIVY